MFLPALGQAKGLGLRKFVKVSADGIPNHPHAPTPEQIGVLARRWDFLSRSPRIPRGGGDVRSSSEAIFQELFYSKACEEVISRLQLLGLRMVDQDTGKTLGIEDLDLLQKKVVTPRRR